MQQLSLFGAACLFGLSLYVAQADDDIFVGPRTEDRFPPLVIPEGFRATLFACDPLVEYPSVIAIGPRPGTLFVAHDYMTGLGVEIVRRDEIRLLEDTDGDGYADKSTLFADGFNSIQGLASDGDAVYAMHAPYLTRLHDVDGDGVVDECRDLLGGLGLPPEENSNRLHCANGVAVGHDGWLYLALGDRGCDTLRPEGDRLLFQEGGILRCRPDGTDLHVFSTGLRNIYDVALDEELNVFVRDNENDGGDYMIRVCHCFFGSDHGYPYHYYERPDEAMPPLADLGRGSSAGGTAYLETSFPQEYRQSLYFCEWGRAVVRYPFSPSGSGFARVQEADFAAGAADDPYGFKPTDLVVDYDGSLLISDWCDGQRPKRGRGRIYRIEFNTETPPVGNAPVLRADESSTEELVSQLDSASYHTRVAAQSAIQDRGEAAIEELKTALTDRRIGIQGRFHAVWILAQTLEHSAIDALFNLAESTADPREVVQAIRAIGDLSDPVLVEDRLDARRGNPKIATRLTQLAAANPDPRVLRETVIALSRLRYADAVHWLREAVSPDALDPALSHALLQLLRRSDNWPAVLELLDGESSEAAPPFLREIALRALAEQIDTGVADGLMARLDSDRSPERRVEYADLLARICRRPGPWMYWGFRPGPRPANPESWERTAAIQEALERRLADPDHTVRAFVLGRIVREELPLAAESLSEWLRDETDPAHVAAILSALASLPFTETRPLLEDCFRNRAHSADNRLEALSQLSTGFDAGTEQRLLHLAGDIEDSPVLAALLRELGTRSNLAADSILLAKLDSQVAGVRAAALQALTSRGTADVSRYVGRLLSDPDADVLREAVAAARVFDIRDHTDRVLELAASPDAELQHECLLALRTLNDPRAEDIATAGLHNEVTRLASLGYLERFGGPEQLADIVEVSQASLDAELQSAAVRAISVWLHGGDVADAADLWQAIASIQGRSGVPMLWYVTGPHTPEEGESIIAGASSQSPPAAASIAGASPRITDGPDAQIALETSPTDDQTVWLAAADVLVTEPMDVEFLASSQGTLSIRLNGDAVFERDGVSEYQPDSDRFAARLDSGHNRILVRIAASDASRFHLRFRRRSSKAEHEQLLQFVLGSRGNADRGREVFANVEKSLCLKCHRMGREGARIGPDLTGVGARFSRVHLLESILDPSRTIAPSYATIAAVLADGRVLSGVKVAEDATTLTIGDNQGTSHQIPVDEIEALQSQEISTMPVGLEQRLTERELLDLMEFLSQQTER